MRFLPWGATSVGLGRRICGYRFEIGAAQTTCLAWVNSPLDVDGEPCVTERSSHAEFVGRLNELLRSPGWAPRVGGGVLAAILVSGLVGSHPLMIVFVWVLAVIAFLLALAIDRDKTLVVFYDLEVGRARGVFDEILEGFRALRDSARTELVDAGPVTGSFQQIRTTSASLTLSSRPPGIEANVATPLFSADFRSICLLPDGVLAFDGREKRAALTLYRDLVVEPGRSPVVETTSPADAEIVSSSRGRSHAVAMYDTLRLSSPTSEIALLQISKSGSAARLVDALRGAGASVVDPAAESAPRLASVN